jgi:hypothetical protein
MDSNVNVCAGCRQPKRINNVYQNGHQQKGCVNGPISEEQKNEMTKIRVAINRALKK